MDKTKIFISTFLLVFLAELGDKTQIASFSMSASSGSPLSVMIGSSLALIASTLMAVLFGKFITTIINKNFLRIVSSLLFIVTGLYLSIKLIFQYFKF